MVVNLNDAKYSDKLFITKDNVHKFVDSYSIYTHYLGREFIVGRPILNPFRDNDSSPSLGVYSAFGGTLMYKDLGSGNAGDCFLFIAVEVYKGSLTYKEAIEQVIVDFNLENKFIKLSRFTKFKTVRPIIYDKYIEKKSYPLRIKSRRYTKRDYEYWNSFNISLETLKKFNVIPISHYSFGNNIFKAMALAYAYIEMKDGKRTYKIYQPFVEKKDIGKFISGMDSSIHSGYAQLPEKGEYLIITKSLKDVMAIYEAYEVPAIAVQGEYIIIKDSVIHEYCKRFTHVFTLFDNDSTGRTLGLVYASKFNLHNLHIPHSQGVKDFSDYQKKYGLKASVNLLKQLFITGLFSQKRGPEDKLPF